MVLWEIATRTIPFAQQQNEQIVGMWIMQGKKEAIPHQIPVSLKALIQKCRDESSKRPTAELAVQELEAQKEIPGANSPLMSVVTLPPQSISPVSLGTPAPSRPITGATLAGVLPSVELIVPAAKAPIKPHSILFEKDISPPGTQRKHTGDLLTLLFELRNQQEIQKNGALIQVLELKIEELAVLPEETPLNEENQRFLNLAKRVMPKGESYNPSAANMLMKQKKEGQEKTEKPTTSFLPPAAAVITPVLPRAPVKFTLPTIAFGKELWVKCIGDVGVEPPLSPDIHQVLQSPCPFFLGKKVIDTHLLTLIPKTVNRKPLTLNSLEKLMKRTQQGSTIQYSYYSEEIKKKYGNASPASSYWVLLTKDVIPESRSKSYDDQKQLLKTYCQRAQVAYEVPHLLEAATIIFLEYLRTGKRLYSDNPWTYTRCEERVSSNSDSGLFVGGFSEKGLDVCRNDGHFGSGGVGGVRKV